MARRLGPTAVVEKLAAAGLIAAAVALTAFFMIYYTARPAWNEPGGRSATLPIRDLLERRDEPGLIARLDPPLRTPANLTLIHGYVALIPPQPPEQIDRVAGGFSTEWTTDWVNWTGDYVYRDRALRISIELRSDHGRQPVITRLVVVPSPARYRPPLFGSGR